MRALTQRALALLLVVSFLLLFQVPSYADSVSVSASSAILYEPSGGYFIYEKDADVRRPMASTTKIMTALTAVDHLLPEEVISIPQEAVGTEGTSAYFKAGEELTFLDLLYALLLQSANDAAVAIAVAVAGSIPAFAALMNEKATALGLRDTHFCNPHGLPNEEHYTTARELAIIAAALTEHPLLSAVAATKRQVVDTSLGRHVFTNHNKLLQMYPDAIGIKTGYTKASGRCLVSAAKRDGVTLIAVTLNAPNDWRDHMQMLDFGFAEYTLQTLVEANGFSYTLPVIGGEVPLVHLTNREAYSCVLPRNENDIVILPDIYAYPVAPISEGQICGQLRIYRDGKPLASLPLYADTAIPRHTEKRRAFFPFSK